MARAMSYNLQVTGYIPGTSVASIVNFTVTVTDLCPTAVLIPAEVSNQTYKLGQSTLRV